jgi:hypothetical protein
MMYRATTSSSPSTSVVQSEQQLTGAMLSMRDQAFEWLAEVESQSDAR